MVQTVANKPGTVPDPARKRGIGRVFLDALAEAVLNFVLFVFLFLWWCARWSFATAFFLALMAGAGYYVYYESLKGGAYVEVPDVTLRPITEASYQLAEEGLEILKPKMVADEQAPKYYVISQRPAPGKVVRTGHKVFLTVSAGTESLAPPSLVDKPLAKAEEEIRRTSFALGTVARVRNTAPRDTVLAQDPASARLVSASTRINLLVSDGASETKPAFIMPDLVGMPVGDVDEALAPYGIKAKPNRVDMLGQRFDVVLDQRPAAGTLVQEGDVVTYDVYPSGSVQLPDAQRYVRIVYVVPHSWFEREVRLDTIDRNGKRETQFPLERHYVNGMPPKFRSGQTIKSPPIGFIEKMTVEIYLDGQLAQTHVYEGENEPVITQYTVQ